MFTRQHYKAIAAIINDNGANCGEKVSGRQVAKWISLALSDYFADDNERFNRQKFLDACGIES
jgi:hypothetical protein